MIVVTRPNDSQFAVNPDLIERIHANIVTTLVMVDGSTFTVTESMAEVIDRIAAYRALVIVLAGSRQDKAKKLGALGETDAPPQPVARLEWARSAREGRASRAPR